MVLTRSRIIGEATISVGLSKRLVLAQRQGRPEVRGLAHKTAFFGMIGVGSPKQMFEVVFDTGSGNLLIPGRDCHSTACMSHRTYSENASSSARRVPCTGKKLGPGEKYNPDEVTIDFGTGEIWGHCVEDEICIGSVCQRGSLVSASFESTNPFQDFAFDGILGLSLPQMSQGADFNVMSLFGENLSLRRSIFSIFLSEADSESSEVSFGELKRQRMLSKMIWANVSSDSGYWEVELDDIALNNRHQKLCEHCRVALDSGTSEIAGPSAVIDKLIEKLGVQTDCSNLKQLPMLGFVVNGYILNLEPKDYVDVQGGRCDYTLMPMDVPPPKGPLFVFGIPFLSRFYTAYSIEKRKVGIAVARHEGLGPRDAARLMVRADGASLEAEASWFTASAGSPDPPLPPPSFERPRQAEMLSFLAKSWRHPRFM